ncbi:L,D-transpeptidase [Acuticoccus sp. M5D2P5]|uniref:L,D-transpeptidase n=1 Tax=Acuticoccus kalidii TaxID=2910977 RepID=UPI001F2BBF72|nr:L,D-transpeptidase [Acuticoccus kalidii]MCF3932774.1 L,D-transpeptidase [Acuticoccus kalidii]
MRSRYSAILMVWLVACGLGMATQSVAASTVIATIDLSTQTMYVSVGGRPAYTWAVSTGRKGYRTPTGNYRPTRMYKKYFSRKYDNSPMPYSIFFRGGYAIHGTYYTKRLGRPASHGCVRLHPNNARTLYDLVAKHGRGNTRIRVRY